MKWFGRLRVLTNIEPTISQIPKWVFALGLMYKRCV